MSKEDIGQSGCRDKFDELESHIAYMINKAGSGHYASRLIFYMAANVILIRFQNFLSG